MSDFSDPQFRNTTPGVQKPAERDPLMDDFFAQMGKPIGPIVRKHAFQHCIDMGLDKTMAVRAVDAVAECLERDNPYGAQEKGMQFLDVTGMYRLMAALLTPEASIRNPS